MSICIVLVTFYSCGDPITKATHKKKALNWGCAHNIKGLVHYHHGRKHHGIHGTAALVQNYILICRLRERAWAWRRLLKPQSPPPVTCLLQQGHTYSDKSIPPNPFQTVPLPGN